MWCNSSKVLSFGLAGWHGVKTRSKPGKEENVVRSLWCALGIFPHGCYFWRGYGDVPKATGRNLWKGGICSGPRECQHCLWQPDSRSSYMSKYKLDCPAWRTFEDLIHNPKRGIIRTIGSRFLCTALCSQALDPSAFISSRGIFHLPFYDLFSIGWGWAEGLCVLLIMRTIRAEQLLITQSYDPLNKFLLTTRHMFFSWTPEIMSGSRWKSCSHKLNLMGLLKIN